MQLLIVDEVVKRFGGEVVLNGVSLEVEQGSVHGVIGPNGAGKTTLFNVISSIYNPDGGRILFKGADITHLRPSEVARRGIGRTFQVARVFNEMTLLENMVVPMVPTMTSRREVEAKAMAYLELAGLDHLRDQVAIEISGGQKKLLEFVRTMMLEPGLILLDEPFAGINPALVDRLSDMVLRLKAERGTTFLLISHEIPSVVRLCEIVTVLAAGTTIARGTPEQVRHDPAVIEAYLGH